MRKLHFAAGFVILLFAAAIAFPAQPRMKAAPAQTSYQVGDRLDRETFVFDREGRERKIVDLIGGETRVVVLILFGGGVKTPPDRAHFRGGLWCEDSFDDLAIQRAAVHTFAKRGVQFIPVALPPMFHSDWFGWEKDVFRSEPDSSSLFRDSVDVFIRNTETLREKGLLPFDEVFYDPRFRLSMNQKEEMGAGYGTIHPWQGKFKWHSDARLYGTPTIWFLDPSGRVLAEPLFGNDYDGDPPEIRYGFSEVRSRIDELLAR